MSGVEKRRLPFGGAHHLRLSTNAMVRYQEATGETVFAGIDRTSSGGDIRALRTLVWAALEPEASPAEAGDLIDAVGLYETGRLVGEMVQLAFPDRDGAPEDASGNAPAPRKKQGTS